MSKLNCCEAKKIDLVVFLQSLNIHPATVRGSDYWYLSPFRQENTPSFKVNRTENLWYDFALGRGGSIIDLGTELFKCNVSDFLQQLTEKQYTFSLHQQEKKATPGTGQKQDTNIKIVRTGSLTSSSLLDYLEQRAIPIQIARDYLEEVTFKIKDRQHIALGFKNRSGGYELRNRYFKGSSSPKDISLIDNNQGMVAVFEGFMDCLSYLVFQKEYGSILSNFLVLNSLAFIKQVQPLMEEYKKIYLFLDNDAAGNQCKKQFAGNDQYIDCSNLYKGYKDLNDWLQSQHGVFVQQKPRQEHSKGLRP